MWEFAVRIMNMNMKYLLNKVQKVWFKLSITVFPHLDCIVSWILLVTKSFFSEKSVLKYSLEVLYPPLHFSSTPYIFIAAGEDYSKNSRQKMAIQNNYGEFT